MGRFFTSVQIRSNNSKEQFIKSFSNMMKKRGFVPCSEDEAVSSYILAFSESGKWVTLTCEDYSNNPKQAHDDAKQTAAEMKTSSFSMDVVDSDWTYIELYTGTDIHDTVIVGRSEFPDDDSPKGRRECWEQLLVSGKRGNSFLKSGIRTRSLLRTLCTKQLPCWELSRNIWFLIMRILKAKQTKIQILFRCFSKEE